LNHNFEMESLETTVSTMKGDPVPPDPPDNHSLPPTSMLNQSDNVMQMLMAISSQMVATAQDLQDRQDKNDVTLMATLQKISDDHDYFKREIRQELQCLQSPSPMVGNSSSSNGFQHLPYNASIVEYLYPSGSRSTYKFSICAYHRYI